ncbi:MAG: AAC(3) family N-acetyltransferase [Planctomyces sp.]|nr:AAC(3) family N-acetyltransferase [Planctomyces sp.]
MTAEASSIQSARRRLRRFAQSLVRQFTCPTVTAADLARDFETIGVRRNGVLLVHSSLSAIGNVQGGPSTVCGALVKAVGFEGTLMMPAHTWWFMNRGCREFDVRQTPAQVGAIAECFRRDLEAIRSLHPTHSVAARGPQAREFTQGHELAASPCGAGTPYARLMDASGQILLLGVGLRRNTCFHAVEALAALPYLLKGETDEFAIVDAEGRSRRLHVQMHARPQKYRFDDLADVLAAEGILRTGRIGQAPSFLLEGRTFRDFLLSRLAEDPEYLLRFGH